MNSHTHPQMSLPQEATDIAAENTNEQVDKSKAQAEVKKVGNRTQSNVHA